MRELFKSILKSSGTPVLQTFTAEGETILSAGNIWTSAHVRRIALREAGLAPGDVLCSASPGFAAVIDFVACAIGGFAYFPVSPELFATLHFQLAGRAIPGRAGIMLAHGTRMAHYPAILPEVLHPLIASSGAVPALILARSARPPLELSTYSGEAIAVWLRDLTSRLGARAGSTRLSYRAAHHDVSFVVDLMLGIYNRQTIYLRPSDPSSAAAMVREMIDLDIDDLVLSPAMIEPLARKVHLLDAATRNRLSAMRLGTGGEALSERQREIAGKLFDRVFVETARLAHASPRAADALRVRLLA